MKDEPSDSQADMRPVRTASHVQLVLTERISKARSSLGGRALLHLLRHGSGEPGEALHEARLRPPPAESERVSGTH